MRKNNAFENITSLTDSEQRQLAEDLGSVGITSPSAIHNVFITSVDGDLMRALSHQLRVRKNTLIFGESGWGKALPNYQGVLTPDGYKPIGEIQVGDLVASNDGKFYPVLGAYPQGKQPVYEITFNYGIKCRCSDEHIWTVSRDYGKTYKDETLNEILKKGYKEVDKKTGWARHKVELPLIQPIEYSEKELPIDPYLLGCLIGDGGLSNDLAFTSADSHIVDKVSRILERDWNMTLKQRKSNTRDFSIAFIDLAEGRTHGGPGLGGPLKNKLKDLGLLVNSYNKHIPEMYLTASVKQRKALLAGLMDTDGYISTCEWAAQEYTTVSKKLAEGIQTLAESLGYLVKFSGPNKSGYRANGEYKKCADTYTLGIRGDEILASLPRKVEAQTSRRKLRQRLRIHDIQYIANEECTCIKVAAPNHLFLTEHCIPTHNTQIVEQIAEALGYELVKITASTKVPEDFGGRPMGNTEHLSDELRKAIVHRNIALRKAQDQLPEKIKEEEEAQKVKLGVAGKRALLQKLLEEQEITEEEIEAELSSGEDFQRMREIYAAPDWVYKILDDYVSKKKRTILFLDEINQAGAETLNTLFQLVDTGKFADKKEYDMSGAIVCVAAGNFRRENRSLTKLPAPLVRRFPTVIYYLGDWGASIDYLQSKYSHNGKLVELLEDIRMGMVSQLSGKAEGDKVYDFENPAILEAAIKDLNDSMRENLYIENYKQIIRVQGRSQQLIDKFIVDNKLDDPTRVGGPGDGAEDLTQHYGSGAGSAGYILAINKLKILWKNFASSKKVAITTGWGAKKVLFYTRNSDIDQYYNYLRGLEEFKDVPEDIWDIILTSTPSDMSQWAI